MKRLSITVTLLLVGFCVLAGEKQNKHPLMASDTVVWAGLDYSMVRMIGANELKNADTTFSDMHRFTDVDAKISDLHSFNGADAIFPSMLERWNMLFIDERLGKVERALGKRVSFDIGGVMERNKTATPNQIILTSGPIDVNVIKESHITQQDIATEVQSYKLEKTNGLGLVFIVDRLVHQYRYTQSHTHKVEQPVEQSAGAVYVVFFDVATREVISTERQIHHPGGNGFRNFWFGVIKRTDENLSKYREPVNSSRESSSQWKRR
jgi:hypothetical protein